jgi:RNA polymerase sigma-70 factor (ECF subfamily)
MTEGFERGFPPHHPQAPDLEQYHLLHAARADLLRRLGRSDEAAAAYRRALRLAMNEVERNYLSKRLKEVAP